jgi:hypothetical protein
MRMSSIKKCTLQSFSRSVQVVRTGRTYPLLQLLPAFGAFARATPMPAASIIERAAALVPLSPQCDVAMIEGPAGWRIFYQDQQTGGINVYNLNRLFDAGHTTVGPTQIVPASEVLSCTPIAATPRNDFNQVS